MFHYPPKIMERKDGRVNSKLRQVRMYNIQLNLKQIKDGYDSATSGRPALLSETMLLAKSLEELAYIVDDLASTIEGILEREGRTIKP